MRVHANREDTLKKKGQHQGFPQDFEPSNIQKGISSLAVNSGMLMHFLRLSHATPD